MLISYTKLDIAYCHHHQTGNININKNIRRIAFWQYALQHKQTIIPENHPKSLYIDDASSFKPEPRIVQFAVWLCTVYEGDRSEVIGFIMHTHRVTA